MRTTNYYIVEERYRLGWVGYDYLTVTTDHPGKRIGWLGTKEGVSRYARGDFGSEVAAREYIEQILAETCGGVCECTDDGCDGGVVARYRTGVTVDANEGCF